jgi:hypothetical protein
MTSERLRVIATWVVAAALVAFVLYASARAHPL